MRKQTILIVALLALGFGGAGCGNKANQVAVVTKTAPSGPVELW